MNAELKSCKRVLLQWQGLYAKLATQGPMIARKLDCQLPPADHVRVLERIDELLAYAPSCECTAYCTSYPSCRGGTPKKEEA